MGTLTNAEDYKKVKARIQSLRPDSQRLWGKMTVNQVLPHLTDQIRCAKGDIQTKPVGGIMLRTLVKWLIMAGLKAPKGKVQTAREFSQEQDGTKPTTFEQDKEALLTLVDWFHNAPQDYTWRAHPAFGQMNKRQWAKMIHSHLEHHLAQFGA